MTDFILPARTFPFFQQLPAWRELLENLKQAARPPVSLFRVSCVAIGKSGKAYVGVNLEFEGMPIGETVHAEQFAVCLAHLHGETGLTHLFVSAMPCGHCRQFLMELGHPTLPMTVLEGEKEVQTTLAQLLPYPFTLARPGTGMLQVMPSTVQPTDMATAVHQAALRSYTPYTKQPAGLTFRLKDGTMINGSSLESAAYNPTLPPLQSALIHLVSLNRTYDEIVEAVLMETSAPAVSYAEITQKWMAHHAPEALFRAITLPG
jgi:cytidine deaminase